MATEFVMPKLGLTMEEGTILEWLAEDGDVVEVGAAVLRIETDKVDTDIEASSSGLLHRLGEVGESYKCGQLIGYLLEEGEKPPALATTPSATAAPTPATALAPSPAPRPQPAPTTGRLLASPNARRVAIEQGIDITTVIGSGPGGRIVSRDVVEGRIRSAPPPPPPPPAPARSVTRLASLAPATAAARQLADLLGIDLAAVPVDPREGRVTRDGVAVHVRGLLTEMAASAQPPLSQTPTEVVKLRGMRGTIAKRMHASLREMAQLTLSMDADMDAVVADRDRRKGSGAAPSFTDYMIAATARALHEHPMVNSQITDEGIAVLPGVHVGMAVSVDNGLMVPVVRQPLNLDLSALAQETARLALAARDGKLTMDDLEGATFSVSTLGMYGVDGFTPIINPPNAAILGVGRLRDDVIIDNGDARTTKRLTLSLTWDHRVLDGAPAAAFCQSIVRFLSQPDVLDATR